MKITFNGAAGGCVTGSNYLVETNKYKFLVDCGMFQGGKALKENNYKDFTFDPTSIDFVLVTHAHIDHTGLLPKLVKHGFKGNIYASEPTVDLLKFLLPDSAHIQEFEVLQKNRRNERKGLPEVEPIYGAEDAENAIALLKPLKRGTEFSPIDGCKVVYWNAGHVLGSSFIEVSITEDGKTKKIVFSGDLGEKDHPIVKDPEYFSETDFLLVESTYGDRKREVTSKEDRLKKLAEVFNSTIKKGGNLIIPAFALERTQDLMHDILILKGRGEIPGIKVVVDSPLATNITKVFVKYKSYYDEDATAILNSQGSLFDHPDFIFTQSPEESMALNGKKGIAILSASGMCDAGRIKHHLKHNLWKPENTVLFVGYQAFGTLGRMITEGKKTVRIHGEEVSVEAEIQQIHGYSGHADQAGLLDWLSNIKKVNGQVFVTHGEQESAAELVRIIKEQFKFEAVAPGLGETFDLIEGKIKEVAPEAAPLRQPVKVDSHNLYAEVMLKLADFMRSSSDESKKRKLLENFLKDIG